MDSGIRAVFAGNPGKEITNLLNVGGAIVMGNRDQLKASYQGCANYCDDVIFNALLL